MKKQFFFMLSVLAIALPLSLSLQSCGDDDDDPQVTNTELSGSDTGDNDTGGGDTGGNTGGDDTGGNASDYGNPGGNDYVATGSYTDLTEWSVKLLCSLNSSKLGENATGYTFGVVVSDDEVNLKKSGNFLDTNGVTGNQYEVSVDNLRPDTKYYYCAYISLVGASRFFASETKSFTTKELSLQASDATDITHNSASFSLTLSENLGNFYEIGILLSPTDKVPTVSSNDAKRLRAIPDNNGNYTVKATGLTEETTYYYCAYMCTYNYEYFYGKVKTFATKGLNVAVSGAVDLGLSVKWAASNLGASSPEEYGDYYAWGETATKSDYSWSTYLKSLGATITSYSDCGTSKDPLRAYVYGGSCYNVATKAGVADGIGGTKYDVARVKLGGKWRMPTQKEQAELSSNCTWTWTTYKGKNGYIVESKTNGNSIFLPAAGYHGGIAPSGAGLDGSYWSSTPSVSRSRSVCFLYFDSDYFRWNNIGDRLGGQSVLSQNKVPCESAYPII